MLKNTQRGFKSKETTKSFDLYGPSFDHKDLIKRLQDIKTVQESGKWLFHKTSYSTQTCSTAITTNKTPRKSSNFKEHRKFPDILSLSEYTTEDEIKKKRERKSTIFRDFRLQLLPLEKRIRSRNMNSLNSQRNMIKVYT